MVDALDSYEAAAGSCEIKGWKDQRTFLQLLQQRAQTEHDILMLLAHFRGEPDAQQYLARALLRRLLDAGLVAAVQNALFGELVDWYDVDRRVALELDPDDQIKIVRDALARAPGDPQGERRLIAMLVKQGKIEDAVARGRRLREQGLMTPGLAQQLGEVLVAHGKDEEARRLFSEIVEFDPRSAGSRRLLGDIFLRHGWYAGAYRQYRNLVELAPEDVGASIRVARAAAGAGRVDEGLRVLRKVAAGEGRPGVNDPRRWARLHAAAYLGGLLASPSQEVSEDSISRELKRLQVFDGPSAWTLLVWEDLEARLVLAAAEEGLSLTGDAVDAGSTGLHALQLPPSDAPKLVVRHSGPVLDREVKYTIVTLRWDGAKFDVQRSEGSIPAGRATEDKVASAGEKKEETDQAG
jgi:tetratricopeptide (TPR) repeat protein